MHTGELAALNFLALATRAIDGLTQPRLAVLAPATERTLTANPASLGRLRGGTSGNLEARAAHPPAA